MKNRTPNKQRIFMHFLVLANTVTNTLDQTSLAFHKNAITIQEPFGLHVFFLPRHSLPKY